MTETDPLLRSLKRLPLIAPDAGRAARLRARCCAALQRGTRQQARSAQGSNWAAVAIESGPPGTACLVYLAAVIHDLLRLRDL